MSESLQDDFKELVPMAKGLVEDATGLKPASEELNAMIVDRLEWVRLNITSFQHLFQPLIAGLDLPKLPEPLARPGRAIAGAQLGTILGWMSSRVLGQYDLLMLDKQENGYVYFVGPNIIQLETQYNFPPRQFRLWIALHEVTHSLQFEGVPWLKDYLLSLLNQTFTAIQPTSYDFKESTKHLIDQVRSGKNPLGELGILGLVSNREQLSVLRKMQAVMTLLEGHGDVVMDHAAKQHIPEAQHFSDVLKQRRNQASGITRILLQLVGLEAKMRQYAQGEHFVNYVLETGGRGLLDQIWQGPEWLPTLEDIYDPSAWVARVNNGNRAVLS
jgi:coenzyme F420 biosynthesis associated uncharacterized protein